ncbi:MAG: DUF6772 family protein [Armatimonadota bacterium]|nr:DUF6772 family protein [Armatimonadota bacterium]
MATASSIGLSKFTPLETILAYDDFDQGVNGWTELTGNYRQDAMMVVPGHEPFTDLRPPMLSSATFPLVGTHGSMSGIYSLKLATRAIAARAEEKIVRGSLAQCLKRLTYQQLGLVQFEMWFTYKPEADRPGIGENEFRAFGVLWDIQDDEYRYFPAVRYLNAANGVMKQKWQFAQAKPVSDEEWSGYLPTSISEDRTSAVGAKRGIDPQWFGRRYPDGSTDGFREIPNGSQRLCYNETVDKINWHYLRFCVDTARREYVELQCNERTFDLRGVQPTLVEAYPRIPRLLNLAMWVEADTNRRCFLFVDSVVISTGPTPATRRRRRRK